MPRAFVRSFEIIGEAVKNLLQVSGQRIPKLSGVRLLKVRDRLIHGYYGVDYQLVWNVVYKKLPDLDQIEER